MGNQQCSVCAHEGVRKAVDEWLQARLQYKRGEIQQRPRGFEWVRSWLSRNVSDGYVPRTTLMGHIYRCRNAEWAEIQGWHED